MLREDLSDPVPDRFALSQEIILSNWTELLFRAFSLKTFLLYMSRGDSRNRATSYEVDHGLYLTTRTTPLNN